MSTKRGKQKFLLKHSVFCSRFHANKWLSDTKDDKQLFAELFPPKPPLNRKKEREKLTSLKSYYYCLVEIYSIKVKTADVQQMSTIDNIQMFIHGSNGQIDKILLKDHAKSEQEKLFQRGSLDQFEIKHHDIGNVRL